MKLRGNWSYPTPVKFGAGRISELATHVKAAGLKRPLLVTDKALASLPITKQALDLLEEGGLGRAVFSDVDPNPNERNMEAGLAVYRAGVLTNSVTHKKKIIFHPKLLPTVTLCDPELTVGMPKFITAGTGMDALAHCLEAYSSPFWHPMSQGIALEGMRLVLEYLPRAYAKADDIEARAQMMAAAAMGAVAFQKGLGAIHSLSHPVGAVYNTHHGTTNAVVMPR